MAQVTVGDKSSRLQIVDVRTDVIEREREIITPSVHLQRSKGREREIGRGTVEVRRNRSVPVPSCLCKWCAGIYQERGHSRNHDGK